MGMMTNYMENKLTDAMRGQALGMPATWYVALFTTAPDDTGAGTEVTGGSYARVAVAASLAAWAGTQGAGTTVASTGTSGQTSNNAAITFPQPSANWGTVSHWALYDAASGGNMWMYGPMTQAKPVVNGADAPSIPTGQLQLTFDN